MAQGPDRGRKGGGEKTRRVNRRTNKCKVPYTRPLHLHVPQVIWTSSVNETIGWKRGGVMKKAALSVLVVIIGLLLAASVLAESATKEECVAKTKEAVQLINEKGLEAAIAEINKTDGKFVWKDSYVAVWDFQGNKLADGANPSSVGKNYIGWKDSNGKMVIQGLIEIAKTKGEGWLEYTIPKPEENKKLPEQRIFSEKTSYVLRVPGKDLFAFAGVYK